MAEEQDEQQQVDRESDTGQQADQESDSVQQADQESESGQQAQQEPDSGQAPTKPRKKSRAQDGGRRDNDRRSDRPRAGQQRRSRGEDGQGDGSDRQSGSSLTEIIGRATGELKDLIGLPVEGVVSARRTDNGWTLVVQVCELERIPNTMDILANYEVETSGGGSLRGYQRVMRYSRAQTEEH